MEKAGTGIKRIKEACRKNGNKVEFFFSDAFTIEISSNDTGYNVTDNVTNNVTDNVTDRQNRVLLLIKQNIKISTREIAELLGISKRTVLRELDDMKNKKLLTRIGKEKGGHWEIND